MRFPGVPAVATTPAQRLGACFAHFPSPISLPRSRSRVGLRIVLFEACSAFTRVTACTLALSPIRDSLHQRLQPFRYLHSCSGCFRLERLLGGTFTHWESAAFARRTPRAVIPRRPSGHATTKSLGLKRIGRLFEKQGQGWQFQAHDQLRGERHSEWQRKRDLPSFSGAAIRCGRDSGVCDFGYASQLETSVVMSYR